MNAFYSINDNDSFIDLAVTFTFSHFTLLKFTVKEKNSLNV